VTDSFLITCEHGGNWVPAPYRPLFLAQRSLLDSHRGYDLGALVMARALARAFGALLVTSTTTRLLIDLNRSVDHPYLFSRVTRNVSVQLRTKIIDQYYWPYRMQVERHIRKSVSRGRRVIHISSHSFTPELGGKVRGAELCAHWKASLAAVAPALRVRRNYPYAGKGDGLTSYLRLQFPGSSYVGVELEINQNIVCIAGRRWAALRQVLVNSLRMVCVAGDSK